MWERASNDALHDSFKGGVPAVQGIVKWLCGKTGEVGAEKDVGGWTFCEASNGD